MSTKNQDIKNIAKKNNKALAKRIGDKANKKYEELHKRRQAKLNKKRVELQAMKRVYAQNHPEEERKDSDFPCQICYEPLFEDPNQDVHFLGSCNHVYHKECLTQYVQTQIE